MNTEQLDLVEGGRVAAAIGKLRAKAVNDETFAAALGSLDTKMAIDSEEHASFQTLKSQAHVMGRLTDGEAQVVYHALSEVWSTSNGGWATGVDTATKVTITRMMGELLGIER